MRGAAVGLLALAVAAASVARESFVAGGSDSSCYVLQAGRWADVLRDALSLRRPTLIVADPLAREAPWPGGDRAFVPVGHVPSPVVRGASVPMCPAGLSLVMAPFALAGGRTMLFAPIPLFAALLVVATYLAGARFGPRVGLAAAALAAASPIVLYQAVQPVSDIPAAALWTAAIAGVTGHRRAHAAAGGLAAAAAVPMRPNLAPIGLVLALFVLLRPERTWRRRLQEALVFGVCATAGPLAVAAIHTAFYGSPFASGYAPFAELFRLDHVGPNAGRYLGWLLASHTPVVLLALLGPALLPGATSAMLMGIIAVTLALYLPYTVFEDWSFLRFLLPALPPLFILTAAAVDALVRRLSGPPGPARSRRILAVLTAVLAIVFVREAQQRRAFDLQRLESRFERSGRWVDARLPPNALVVSGWLSGAVRFYADRPILNWNAVDASDLPAVVAFAERRQLEPYLMLESWEEPLFRRRFSGTAMGALDWPPLAEVAYQVRIYRPADRERYLAGSMPPTEYVP